MELRLKSFVRYIITVQVLILILHGTEAQFQPAPVVRSQEKTIVNGKIFYIHTVQKGQTLYSISKAYEVTLDDIKRANPQVDVVNLVEGLAIRIPSAQAAAVVYPENREDFIAHEIKRKETVYSLARKYKVDPDVIYYYNPWAKDGIKIDQTLWIPRNKELHDISPGAREEDLFYYYTTKEKDTLYSIAKIYGVEVSDIVEANPQLRNGLRPEQVLKIPKIKTPEPEIEVPDTVVSIPCISPAQPYTYNVAVMLPFFATYADDFETTSDSLSEDESYLPPSQRGLRGRNFAEFYEGFLLAVDSLKKTGLSVNLHVFDTERDTMKTKRILKDLAPVNPDLIIGPVYPEDVKIAGRFARFHETRLISPLSTRTHLVDENPNIVQIMPSRHAEGYAMANYLRQYKKGRIILIRGTDSISMNNSWRFKSYLLENMPVDESGKPLYFQDYKLNDSLYHILSKILSKEEENLLVVFSESEPAVNSLITRLIQRTSIYPVIVFGMPSWRNWTNVDLTFLHALQLHLITPFYSDFSDPLVKNFLRKSRNLYGYEPYEINTLGYNYSMLGYDIGLYFLSGLRNYGRNFMPCSDQIPGGQLLTRYRFSKSVWGGYVNNSYNVIEYRSDFTIEKTGMVSGEPIIGSPNTNQDPLTP